MEVDEGTPTKNQTSSPTAGSKNDFTEDEKYHNLMTWLKCFYIEVSQVAIWSSLQAETLKHIQSADISRT